MKTKLQIIREKLHRILYESLYSCDDIERIITYIEENNFEKARTLIHDYTNVKKYFS